MRAMPLEVWGTFSIADHKRPRAFVADALLYDLLVIPVPEDDDLETWDENGWRPEELRETLSILGKDLVRTVVWTQERKDQFTTRYRHQRRTNARQGADRLGMAAAVEFDASNIRRAREMNPAVDPMYVTRVLLADHASAQRDREFIALSPDVYVEAFAAYPSYGAFDAEIRTAPVVPDEASRAENLAGVFGWEFFVPEDSSMSDEDLLEEAVTLAGRKSFKEARGAFHQWRRELVEHGARAETARADMERIIGRYQEETARVRTKTRVLNGFTIVGGLASLVASFVFPPIGAAGGFLTLASFGAEKLLPGAGVSAEARMGAMFADSRKHFGWHDP
jgi:hypothetical protein